MHSAQPTQQPSSCRAIESSTFRVEAVSPHSQDMSDIAIMAAPGQCSLGYSMPSRSTGMVRRSNSIFSRKGIDEPTTTTSSMLTFFSSPKTSNRRAARRVWVNRRSSRAATGCEGTILHRVPPAQVALSMTPLELAMATCPNDEILSAINDYPPASELLSPCVTTPSNLWNMRGASPPEVVVDSRIGVWRDGVTHWDAESCSPRVSLNRPFVPLPRVTEWPLVSLPLRTATAPAELPNLFVVIPQPTRTAPTKVDALQSQSAPQRLSVQPAKCVTRNATGDSVNVTQPSYDHQEATPSHQSQSRSSSQSSFARSDLDDCDVASTRSRQSSMTTLQSADDKDDCLSAPSIPDQLPRRSSRRLKAFSGVKSTPPSTEANGGNSLDLAAAPAPALPRRSRKRDWRNPTAVSSTGAVLAVPLGILPRRRSFSNIKVLAEQGSAEATTRNVRKTLSLRKTPSVTARLLSQRRRQTSCPIVMPTIYINDGLIVVEGPEFEEESSDTTAADAQAVLFKIMASLNNVEDLSAMSTINRGMYTVYKENELELVREVLHNLSPAALELREWTSPSVDEAALDYLHQGNHTPSSYIRAIKQDKQVIEELKELIIQQCQGVVRAETMAAFSGRDEAGARRLDNAFYRIWCFCKIFGSGKGREEDITGQLDWLKGGILAHQQGCNATIDLDLDFDMASVLLSAPEHFAKCNLGGLSAEQLYDVMEVWTCLTALLQEDQSRVDHARQCGIFKGKGVSVGNLELEEHVLAEWISWILTLGPPAILKLARPSTKNYAAGFEMARVEGWTEWELPVYSGTRSTFLKDPVARLYEAHVAAAAAPRPLAIKKKEISHKRASAIAAELRLAHNSSTYRRLPLADVSTERPVSVVSRHDSVISVTSPKRPSPPPMVRAMVAGQWSPRNISPIIGTKVDTFNRLSMHSLSGLVENTADKAIKKIVDMGFSESAAKEALRLTDVGNGLRVDVAVDMLLARQR